jgi:FKBP-type peptidyl-prolyl cis-trans isomerase (trigger factor)
MKKKLFTLTKKEEQPGSMFLIEGELSVEALDAQKKTALDKFQQIVAIDGFRKGHIPENKLIEHVGALALLEEQGSLALEASYEEIIKETGIGAIGSPLVSITKIAPGLPLGFKIETAVIPEITLPSYKKIAKEVMNKKEDEIVVDDKEVDEAIEEVRKSVAHQKLHDKVGETENHDHEFKAEDLPVVDDAFVKTLGKFENVEDFKSKIKANLLNEKQVKAREKKRIDTIEQILKGTKVEVPEVLIESELIKMIGQFKDSISSMGLSYEQYLERVKKSEDDIRAEWKGEAKKRATIQLVLNKISADEKIVVDEKEIDHQVKELMTYYKEADPIRMQNYVETMMTNEKVWKFLEDQK